MVCIMKLNMISGTKPRVDSAFKNSFIITNFKKTNPIDQKDWASFKIEKDGVKYTTCGENHGNMVSTSFKVEKKITDKPTLKKVLNFFKKQDFDLLNISDVQKVSKEAFQNTKKDFIEGLSKLLRPERKIPTPKI